MPTEIHDVTIYRHRTIPPPDFYVTDLLPKEGLMLLFGSPKIGKSWLGQQLAFCIATGSPFLGFSTIRGKVLIAQFEIAVRAYQWRLRTQMMNHFPQLEAGSLYEMSPGQIYLDDPQVFAPFAAQVASYNPDVILIDCLQACFGGDENNSREVGRFIHNIEQLKNQNHASIVLIHHSRKNPSMGSFADNARGQSRLAGWVDTLVNLEKQPQGVKAQFMSRQATRELDDIRIRFVQDIFERR
ncbi:MAG: AAA family ATPase [Dehalococcoidales bacterium]|jgi:RecA-family ATPase|nr:AAA family ATPase [Dehalococcoidales bacterium]